MAETRSSPVTCTPVYQTGAGGISPASVRFPLFATDATDGEASLV